MYDYQYGTSRAAIVLTRLISEHAEPRKMERKVGRILSQFTQAVAHLDDLEDQHVARFLYGLIAKYFSDKVLENFDAGMIATYTLNVISTYKKQWLEKSKVSR
jgi:hypothetical protein